MSALAYKIAQNLPQGLSAEIGDIFYPAKTGNIEKSFILTKKQSILLAEYIKTAHKKADLFPSRLFGFASPISYSITF